MSNGPNALSRRLDDLSTWFSHIKAEKEETTGFYPQARGVQTASINQNNKYFTKQRNYRGDNCVSMESSAS